MTNETLVALLEQLAVEIDTNGTGGGAICLDAACAIEALTAELRNQSITVIAAE